MFEIGKTYKTIERFFELKYIGGIKELNKNR